MLHDRNEGGLRKHVRSALAADHARVNSQLTQLDIQSRNGLIVFLQAHRAAFDALVLSGASLEGRVKKVHLSDILKAIDVDLKALRAPILRLPREKYNFNPLAVDHIVLGSRMESTTLRNTWLMSPDRQVRQARAYFAQPQFKDEWRAHCLQLSAMNVQDRAGQHLIEDARRLFVLFESALDACR